MKHTKMECFEINETIPIIRYKKSQTVFKDIIIKKSTRKKLKKETRRHRVFLRSLNSLKTVREKWRFTYKDKGD